MPLFFWPSKCQTSAPHSIFSVAIFLLDVTHSDVGMKHCGLQVAFATQVRKFARVDSCGIKYMQNI